MRGVERRLHALEPVAVRLRDGDPDPLGRKHREREVRERRRLVRAEPHPDHPAALEGRVVGDGHLGGERLRVGAVRRHVDDRARHVDLPRVEDAPEPALLVARERERRAAVRTALVEEADPTVRRPERHVVATHQADAHGRTVGDQLRGDQRRDPVVLAEQRAHWRVALDPGQQLVLFARHHVVLRCSRSRCLVDTLARVPGGGPRDSATPCAMEHRYVVHGAGAVGGTIGARLFEAGHDVVLIARGSTSTCCSATACVTATPSARARWRSLRSGTRRRSSGATATSWCSA